MITLIAVAMHMLVRDLPGNAARIARLTVWPFVVFYGAGEAILGVATGVRVHNGDASGALALWDNAILADLLPTPGSISWVVAAIAAAVAYRRPGAPIAVPALLAISSLAILHGPPIGPFALVCFAAAVVVLAHQPATTNVKAAAVDARA